MQEKFFSYNLLPIRNVMEVTRGHTPCTFWIFFFFKEAPYTVFSVLAYTLIMNSHVVSVYFLFIPYTRLHYDYNTDSDAFLPFFGGLITEEEFC